ncbi:hypothetical protein EZJ43_01280 [Pedobacter changchengzhani]|uniref:Uncharacterized protein n=1 Tax=Pedobacter changchengzhani TaxID=2529274 RepID=A0A4R5MQP7_9SPHI|nr:hypothetical protein EZJ43_01280 [Pedobacter changchengzhani]
MLQFIWLFVNSITNLNAEKCGSLKSRTVTLFIDLNGFDKWNSEVKELSSIANVNISNLLEQRATATEKIQDLDIVDYLIKFDYIKFNAVKDETLSPIYKEVEKRRANILIAK